ncbi:hypothetical protein MBLNU457_7349t1 [Dothideomycetes sp. NU457]
MCADVEGFGQESRLGNGMTVTSPKELAGDHRTAWSAFRDYAKQQAGSTTDEGSTAQYGVPPCNALPPVSDPVHPLSEPQELVVHEPSSIPNHVNEGDLGSRNPKPAVTKSDHVVMSVNDVHHLLRGCLRRIEVLESLSSSHVPIEELEDKFENLDARLLDLETWRIDSEAQQKQRPSHRSRSREHRRSHSQNSSQSFGTDASSSSNDSDGSSSSTLSATAAVYAAYAARFDSLEDRVGSLETILPSFSHPWHIEVVLLPFGKHLRGIWITAEDEIARNQSSMRDNNEWAGFQSSKNSFPPEVSEQHDAVWTSESISAWADSTTGWLCPKACGPNGVVYKRLASLGLVKDLSISCPDAHGIIQACKAAFSDFLIHTNENVQLQQPAETFQSLTELIVPLRKIKQSSRLRHLTPNEMVTSACWNATFLESIVIMKARQGIRRLYVTTPDAYIQGSIVGWTWSSLRRLAPDLSRSPSDREEDDEFPRELEPCWAHYPALDGVSRSESSSTSDFSELHPDNTSDHQVFTQEVCNGDDDWARMSISHDIQTSSMPTPFSGDVSQAVAARRTRRSASIDTSIDVRKRRRISRSSRGSRRGTVFTPRPSREPASPHRSGDWSSDHNSDGDANARYRTTPNAYATPHSNTTNIGAIHTTMGS